MFPNVKATEQVALVGFISPSAQAVGALTSGWLSMAYFNKLLIAINVGVFGASATVDATVQQATSAAGAGAKAFTNSKSITQQLAAGGNGVQVLINIDAQEFDVANGFNYFQLSVTVGTAITATSANIFGFVPRDADASIFNIATTAAPQIVG